MCLIVLAYRQHPRYRLIVAANRDEYYRRPTAPAHFWPDHPVVLAGRDLEQQGTWLGISRTGRFAALTNYRDPTAVLPSAKSRGALVSDYLCGGESPAGYLAGVNRTGATYNGFNLLIGDAAELLFYSSRTGSAAAVSPGIHGLSNHVLDTPWPKVVRAKAALAELLAANSDISTDDLFDMLQDTGAVPDALLPNTGVGAEWERILAPIFIVSPDYGTRSSTVLLQEYSGRVLFVERNVTGQREQSFRFDVG
ncbi:MAG: NRDE family protein [Negativicutes bacterium]|nr:NRDE family protein [Negativicutes bacterium]